MRHLALVLLALIATVQYFDRALMVVMLEPIKLEFALTDSQLGFLSGFSYATAFALAGIPMGWLADRSNRHQLLAMVLGGWSVLLALAASTSTFTSLVLTRVGIGAMDAGGQPCSISMIADIYPPAQRVTAVAVFYASVPLGMALGFMIGGMVVADYGWRAGFYVAAVPGFILTFLIILLMREPKRGASDNSDETQKRSQQTITPRIMETMRFMRRQASLMNLMFASVLVTATSSAMMSWIGSLLIRGHGLSLPQVGILTAVCLGGFGILGTILFGLFCDRMGKRDMRWQPRLMAFAAAMIAVCGIGVALLPGIVATAVALALFAAFVAGLNGPTYALTQSLVEVRMRGLSISTLVVALNLIGVGAGPTLAGFLSDGFSAHFGADSVRWAMACVLTLNLPAVWIFWRASNSILPDLQRVAHAQ